MKTVQAILAAALCAFFACESGARTLYVDARRPNNNGNGRSLRNAKCTIQAAINIAKKGDTILVYPGSYTAVATNNRKIRIKARYGASKTVMGGEERQSVNLGKFSSGKGTKTSLLGFHIGFVSSYGGADNLMGGTVKSCSLTSITISHSKLTCCTLGPYPPPTSYKVTYLGTAWGTTHAIDANYASFNRCKIWHTHGSFSESKLANCLFIYNGDDKGYRVEVLSLMYCTLANCTVADNNNIELVFLKAYNTIFYKVPASQFKKSQHNKLKNCYKGTSPKFIGPGSSTKWVADENGNETGKLLGATVEWKGVEWAEVIWESDYDWGVVEASGATDEAILADARKQVGNNNATYEICERHYERGYHRTKLLPGNYKLKKGSRCINKGKLTTALKKLVGTKDLAGKKRVKGKAIDIGCYEY